jgi:hypothetical protein
MHTLVQKTEWHRIKLFSVRLFKVQKDIRKNEPIIAELVIKTHKLQDSAKKWQSAVRLIECYKDSPNKEARYLYWWRYHGLRKCAFCYLFDCPACPLKVERRSSCSPEWEHLNTAVDHEAVHLTEIFEEEVPKMLQRVEEAISTIAKEGYTPWSGR